MQVQNLKYNREKNDFSSNHVRTIISKQLRHIQGREFPYSQGEYYETERITLIRSIF